MFFKQFLREQLGCASYIVGDTEAGVCAVVDPHWTIDDYLEVARQRGLKITHIFETHIHADHISGNRKLAALTGAKICIHRAGQAAYAGIHLEDGDEIKIGAVGLRVIHTPGHTPESIVLAVSDSTRSAEPWLALTGDTLFIDDVGRPDLAGPQGAAELYDSFQSKLLKLDSSIEVYPAHVAGSLCGRAMNLKTSSTIGYERRFNRALQALAQGKAAFVQNLTADLPLHSPSFENIIAINRQGPPDHDLPLQSLATAEAGEFMAGGGVPLDVRDNSLYVAGHLPGSVNVPLSSGQLASQVSWLIRPTEDILLVAETPQQAEEAARELGAVRTAGQLARLEGGLVAWKAAGSKIAVTSLLTPTELQQKLDMGEIDTVLDVREASEWQNERLPGAANLSYRQLSERWSEFDRTQRIAVICAGGFRSAIATSVLERFGFAQVYNILGGLNAWKQNGFPTVEAEPAVHSINR